MLTEIKLTNFKCFKEETSIPLSQFNLFTGVNGAGKSTALQALLLMRQSIEDNPYTTELILNGSCVNLGSFDNLINKENLEQKSIYFEFLYTENGNTKSIFYTLNGKIKNDEELFLSRSDFYQYTNSGQKLKLFSENINQDGDYQLESEQQEAVEQKEYTLFNNLRFELEKIHFISADRIGPKDIYSKSALSPFPHIDANGEFTVNILDKMAEEIVNEKLYSGIGNNKLMEQTQAWLGKILNPLSLKINPLGNSHFLELLIGDFTSSNVGFGYSSILPIIVTGLIAQPGEKIIIENPEIHLHPKAQSVLIEFLVKVSKTGVQVFIESHSDHILNAVRIAVLKQKLTPEETNILYFENNRKRFVHKIPIQDDGRIEEWPEGFFDQMNNDLSILFGV
jgi:predicted ATPase